MLLWASGSQESRPYTFSVSLEVLVKRFVSMILATTLVLLAHAGEHEAVEPGATPLPAAHQAMVRVVHASPNAELEQATLTLVGDDVAQHDFGDVAYMEMTDYVPVLGGDYTLTIDLAAHGGRAAMEVELPQTLSVARGRYYTVALVGLVMPEEAEESDDGFLAWLQELFTADRDDLALRAVLLDDITTLAVMPGEAEVRILHAAPGTDSVDLVFAHEEGADVLASVAYADVSGYTSIEPDAGTLQIRAAGSDLVMVDLAEFDVAQNMIHTVVVTGTPIEDVPTEAMLVSNEWVDPMPVAPGAPGTVAPVAGVMTADQAEWVRDQVIAAEVWLDAAEERLLELAELAEAEELAVAARQDILEARAFLDQARFQLETAAGPGLTQPATDLETPADPDD